MGSLQFYFLTIIQIIMKKKVTFSRKFPAKHPRAGEPTAFVAKILLGLPEKIGRGFVESHPELDWDKIEDSPYECKRTPHKHHTIRAGKNWKVGDILIPCVWELDGGRFTKGNKRIQFAPELEIVKVWDIEIEYRSMPKRRGLKVIAAISVSLCGVTIARKQIELAENDGLSYEDFRNWFMMDKKSFSGQVICWNKEVEY